MQEDPPFLTQCVEMGDRYLCSTLVFAFSMLGEIYSKGKDGENENAAEADLPAEGEGFVLIEQGEGVITLGHRHSDHAITHKYDVGFYAINIGGPVTILRNRRMPESRVFENSSGSQTEAARTS